MKMNEIKTPAELKQYVEARDGVASLPMWIIRDVYGHERLGRHVRDRIGRELSGLGLVTYPGSEDIPEYQHAEIRLIKQGTPAADLMAAFFKVGRESDKVIRQFVSDDSKQLLEEIQAVLERRS